MSRDPFRLVIEVTHADNGRTRWAGDEPDGENVPRNLRFGDQIPGGFRTLGCDLSRDANRVYHDLAILDDTKVYAPAYGNQSVWEGRHLTFPVDDGPSEDTIHVAAVGHANRLRRKKLPVLIVDRDLSAWGQASRARQIALLAAEGAATAPTVAPDETNGLPGLEMVVEGPLQANNFPKCEALYDAGAGNLIAAIYYDWQRAANATNASWRWELDVFTSDDFVGSPGGTGDLQSEPNATGSAYFTPSSARRYAQARLLWNNAAGDAGAHRYTVYFRKLAVYGDHGLTRRGTAPGGFYDSDILPYVLDRLAPGLNYTTGEGGSIEQGEFVIPHAAWRETLVTAEDVILALNGYELKDWAVWEKRTFYSRYPDPGRLTWEVQKRDGALLQLEGDHGDEWYNGVVVSWRNPDGTTGIVGPPGSGLPDTDAALEDTNELNPVNRHGDTNWAHLEVSSTTTLDGAVRIGAIFLVLQLEATRKGTVTVTGWARHPGGAMLPCWAMRSGDYVRVADLNGEAGQIARHIIDKEYDHNARQVTLSVDNSADTLDAIMDRLGISLAGVL